MLAEQGVDRALTYWFLSAVHARALRPASDEEHPRLLGFSAFGLDRRDDEVIDKRFVAVHESGCGRVSRVSPVHTAIRNCTRDEDAMGQAARV